jgi:hypothetical protein
MTGADLTGRRVLLAEPASVTGRSFEDGIEIPFQCSMPTPASGC